MRWNHPLFPDGDLVRIIDVVLITGCKKSDFIVYDVHTRSGFRSLSPVGDRRLPSGQYNKIARHIWDDAVKYLKRVKERV